MTQEVVFRIEQKSGKPLFYCFRSIFLAEQKPRFTPTQAACRLHRLLAEQVA